MAISTRTATGFCGCARTAETARRVTSTPPGSAARCRAVRRHRPSSCSAPATEALSEAPHASLLARDLVVNGVPIVIAMSGRVSDRACRLFTRVFGAGPPLIRGSRLVDAVVAGRRAAYLEVSRRPTPSIGRCPRSSCRAWCRRTSRRWSRSTMPTRRPISSARSKCPMRGARVLRPPGVLRRLRAADRSRGAAALLVAYNAGARERDGRDPDPHRVRRACTGRLDGTCARAAARVGRSAHTPRLRGGDGGQAMKQCLAGRGRISGLLRRSMQSSCAASGNGYASRGPRRRPRLAPGAAREQRDDPATSARPCCGSSSPTISPRSPPISAGTLPSRFGTLLVLRGVDSWGDAREAAVHQLLTQHGLGTAAAPVPVVHELRADRLR